eukprot:Nk52_evm5s326 gene=Nk52_evmTU5s326
MFSQIFIQNESGETIIFKLLRGDVPKEAPHFLTSYKSHVNQQKHNQKRQYTRHGGKNESTSTGTARGRRIGRGGGGFGDSILVTRFQDIYFAVLKHDSGLSFVVASKQNFSAAFAIHFLEKICALIGDYCGIVSEESISCNFILIHELLDEILEYGYPQDFSAERLKLFVHNEPATAMMNFASRNSSPRKSSIISRIEESVQTKSEKPMAVSAESERNRPNEIFVDLMENIRVNVSSDKQVVNFSIEGKIELRSFLKGVPHLALGLSDNILLERTNSISGGGARGAGASSSALLGSAGSGAYGPRMVFLHDVDFKEGVDLELFHKKRLLQFAPESGTSTVMRYHIENANEQKLRIPLELDVGPDSLYLSQGISKSMSSAEELKSFSMESCSLIVSVTNALPPNRVATEVKVSMTLPGGIAGTPLVGVFDRNQKRIFRQVEASCVDKDSKRQFKWIVPEIPGGQSMHFQLHLKLDETYSRMLRASGKIATYELLCDSVKKELGFVGLSFDIPMYLSSGISIKYLRITDKSKNFVPYRWIKYLTKSETYVFKM